MNETIQARMSTELKQQLEQIAKAQGVSLSAVIRDALFEYIDSRRLKGMKSGFISVEREEK
jgi:predicted transcriptional regulator